MLGGPDFLMQNIDPPKKQCNITLFVFSARIRRRLNLQDLKMTDQKKNKDCRFATTLISK